MSSRAEKYYFNLDLLCPTDIEILRGVQLDKAWTPGAAANICLEDMRNWGFIIYKDGRFQLTDKGKQILGDIDATLKAH